MAYHNLWMNMILSQNDKAFYTAGTYKLNLSFYSLTYNVMYVTHLKTYIIKPIKLSFLTSVNI